MSAVVTSRYSIERAEFPSDRDRTIALWRTGLGNAQGAEAKFDWFYKSSVTGTPLTLLLNFTDGVGASQAVGAATTGFRSFRFGSEPMVAGVLVDMVVKSEHRTLFPALLLQKSMLQAGLAECAWLYGFPNKKAAPVFQRAGYTQLGKMTRFVRVLRTASYLSKRLPSFVAVALGAVVDAVLLVRFGFGRYAGPRLEWKGLEETTISGDVDSTGTGSLLRGTRTPEFLQWRFSAERGRFQMVNVYDRGGGNIGYWVTQVSDDVLAIVDCAPGLLAGRTKAAWIALFSEARARGFRSVSFECLAPPSFVSLLHGAGMRPRSDRLVFGSTRTGLGLQISADNTYLTAADEDE